MNKQVPINKTTERKPKEKKTTEKKATEKTIEKPTTKELEERILSTLKELAENGVPVTSTVLKDKLGVKSRGAVRRIMQKLAKDGKVKVTEKANSGKRKQFVYTLQ